MNSRIRSWFSKPIQMVGASVVFSVVSPCGATAQTAAGYYTDPDTGIVYRQVTRTIERPVVETKTETQEQTVYRPQTVTETRPETRTVYTPVIQYQWQPRLEGRWNPFRQPTVAYQHVPRAHWQSRSEVVQRTNTRTEWVAEKRTIEVPQQLVRMQREQKIDFEPVGRVAPGSPRPPVSNDSAIAARLRPLESNTSITPLPSVSIAQTPATFTAPRIAASSVGQMQSDPPRRSASQMGLPSTELYPSPGGYAQPLPPASTGMASLPSLPLWR